MRVFISIDAAKLLKVYEKASDTTKCSNEFMELGIWLISE